MTNRLAMDAHFHGHGGALLVAGYFFTGITLDFFVSAVEQFGFFSLCPLCLCGSCFLPNSFLSFFKNRYIPLPNRRKMGITTGKPFKQAHEPPCQLPLLRPVPWSL